MKSLQKLFFIFTKSYQKGGVMQSTSTSLVPYPKGSIRTWEDIQKYAEDPEIGKLVSVKSPKYYTIDVVTTMNHLKQVGSLLQLALSGAKGHSCSPKTTDILGTYQTVIKNTSVISSSFVEQSIKALNFYFYALQAIEKNNDNKRALELLKKTGEVAGQMAQKAGELVKEAKDLCDKAQDALVTATGDEVRSHQEWKDLKKMIAESQGKEAYLSKKTDQLASDIQEAKDKELKVAKEAKEARDKAFAVTLISTIMQPITAGVVAVSSVASNMLGSSSKTSTDQQQGGGIVQNLLSEFAKAGQKRVREVAAKEKELAIKKARLGQEEDGKEKTKLKEDIAGLESELKSLEKAKNEEDQQKQNMQENLDRQAGSLEQKEEKIAQERAELQKEFRQANAELAETIKKIQTANLERDEIGVSIKSLGLTIQTLGKVKTTFENTRKFWLCVKAETERLGDTTFLEIAESCDQGMFLDEIKNSGLDWLSLANINRTAALAIQGVEKTVDDVMNNLPSKEEGRKLVDSISATILQQIDEENNKITEIS